MDKQIIKVIERIEQQEKVIEQSFQDRNLIIDKQIFKYPYKVGFWNVPKNTAKLLNFLVLTKKPTIILELGCSVAYSTLWIASAAKEINAHVYTTEKFEPKIKIARENIKEAELESIITLIEGNILFTLQNWNKGDIDMIFLDADKKSYHIYYEILIPLMSKGAIIVADNVIDMSDSIKPFLLKLKNDERVLTQTLSIDNGVALIYKK